MESSEMTVSKEMSAVEAALLTQPQVPCPVTHHFGGGIYLREMFAPAGTLILGHEHRGEHMCVLLKGSMKILGDEGQVRTIHAPLIFTAPAGRKLALTLEDVTFMNIHPAEKTDPEVLEERFVRKSEVWTNSQLREAGAQLLTENAETEEQE